MADMTAETPPETQSSTQGKRARFNAFGAQTTTIHLSVNEGLRKMIDEYAVQTGVSRSALIRRLVAAGIHAAKRRRRLER